MHNLQVSGGWSSSRSSKGFPHTSWSELGVAVSADGILKCVSLRALLTASCRCSPMYSTLESKILEDNEFIFPSWCFCYCLKREAKGWNEVLGMRQGMRAIRCFMKLKLARKNWNSLGRLMGDGLRKVVYTFGPESIKVLLFLIPGDWNPETGFFT